MNKENILIIVAGPSGVGKGTVCNRVMEDIESIVFSVSATTRKPREGEKEGINYFYKSHSEFEQMIKKSEFLEYANVFDNKYGTPKKYVIDKIASGKDVLLEIDVQGAMMVMDTFRNGVFIFIVPPTIDALRKRLVGRGTESDEQITLRLSNAIKEIEQSRKFDYIVVNDSVNVAVEEIKSIIISEKCKERRNKENIKQLIHT